MKHDESKNPPSWAIRFFRWYCNDHLSEAVLGDMIEWYDRKRETLGKRKADILFIWNVLQFLQPFAIKKNRSTYNNTAMFHNYLIIAWRSMSRQKMYAGIKIGGFAVGLATCIVIFLYVRNELNYDKNYPDGDRIYRVYNEYVGKEGGKWSSFPAPAAGIMKSDYPEVEKAGRLIPYKGWYNAGENLIRRDDRVENSFEVGFAYADQELIDILQLPFIYGNPAKALAKPNTIVLSRSKAEKLFPKEDPTGKTIILNDDISKPYSVGGVMEDFPSTSHLHFDFLISLTGVEFWKGEQTSWCCWNYNVYLKLRPDAQPKALEKKLLAIRDRHYVGFLKEQGNTYADDVKKNHFFKLQPMGDIYLKSEGIGGDVDQGDSRYVWLFSAIACFILLLACINFINLSTARSANRAKEVGLRKVVGLARGYLVRQFLTESIVYSLLSFVIALLLVWICLPYFNVLAGKSLSIPWTDKLFFPTLIGAVMIIGFLAGIYPSFYLSSFKPVDVLKGSVSRGSKSSGIRAAMVIFQFTTSIALIAGTIVIYRQMNFILDTKVGFDKDQVITVQGVNTLDQKRDAFKTEVSRLSGVNHITINSYLPVNGKRDQNPFWKEGKTKEENSVGAQKWYADEDYITTMGMKLIEGRDFDPRIASDTQAVIINQTMAHEFGFKHAVGEKIQNWQVYTIIGVVEDFHFQSMKEKIGSLCFVYGKGGTIASVKVKTTDMPDMIARLQGVWNQFMPNQPFRYTFLDDSYAQMYDDVQRAGRVFATFAGLAILVACLGLFALSSFMVEQRSKEISIRLVLGASLRSVFRLLTQNFIKLILISFLVAVPLSWYFMQKWLEDFAYRISLSWDMFVIAGGISMLIALLTVSYQSIHAALANPAKNLRSE